MREHGAVVCGCGRRAHSRDVTAEVGLVARSSGGGGTKRRARGAARLGDWGDGDEWIRLGFRNLYTLRGIYWALVGRFLIRPNWNARTL
jgi:hypothetical protein